MSVQNDVRVTVRVDRDLKERADELFECFGMNMTTALNIFLRKVVIEEAIPFSIGAKRTGFGNSLSASDITRAFETAVEKEVANNKREGFPVARYDAVSGKAYLEVAEGEREYLNR